MDQHEDSRTVASPLDAGIAENLVPTASAIDLPEKDYAVPIYMPPGRRAAAAFIFITITLDMLALGMIAPCIRASPAAAGLLAALYSTR